MALVIISCLRQLAHPFLCEVTSAQTAIIAILGIFNGASLLVDKQMMDADATSAAVSFVVGAVFLGWAPVVVWLDRVLIQLRHRKHDSRPQ